MIGLLVGKRKWFTVARQHLFNNLYCFDNDNHGVNLYCFDNDNHGVNLCCIYQL